jgi:hypothetical protein
VEGDEVRMADVGERSELALEAVERVGLVVVEDLQRDRLAALVVEDAVDDAERTGAELGLDTKPRRASELTRGGDPHTPCVYHAYRRKGRSPPRVEVAAWTYSTRGTPRYRQARP